MVRHSIVILQALMAAIAVRGWLVPTQTWHWRLSVGVLELGHWFALPALITAIAGVWLFRWWLRWVLLNVGIVLALGFMVPAYQASKLDKEFQIAKLWSPDNPPTIAPLQRKVFWRNYKDQLDALIFRPLKPTSDRLPWLLMLHTGGWDNGEADEFTSWNRHLTAQGYVIMSMNYHLAPKHKWPEQREDVRVAVKWATEHAAELGIDPDKMVIMGRSAGGQIATACATSMPDLKAKGVIAFYSPMDMEFAHTFSTDDDIIGALKLLRQYLGGDPDTAQENYKSASAINFIGKTTPPTLLLHGARDPLVWVEQSIRYKAKFDKLGLGDRCTFVQLPWAVHGFDYFPKSPGGQVSLYEVTEFLKKLGL